MTVTNLQHPEIDKLKAKYPDTFYGIRVNEKKEFVVDIGAQTDERDFEILCTMGLEGSINYTAIELLKMSAELDTLITLLENQGLLKRT